MEFTGNFMNNVTMNQRYWVVNSFQGRNEAVLFSFGDIIAAFAAGRANESDRNNMKSHDHF